MEQRYTAIDKENICEILDDEALASLLKYMDLTVEKIGESILKEDLKKSSFANVGISLAKYQGARELYNIVFAELQTLKKNALRGEI